MSRTLNQEVSVFNFNGPIRDVKDAFTRDMITENTETSTTASKAYTAGETFIWTDRKVYKAKSAIASGETLSSAANGNIKAVGSIVDEVVKTSDGFKEYVNELGAKNLVPVTYDSIKATLATSSIVLDGNNQAVKNGVTLTVVLDSKGNVAKCNVNGTASADTYFRLWVTPVLNSFGSDALNSILYPTRGSYTISSGTDSEDVAFVYQPNISNEYSGFYIRIANGKTVNVDVYPMLRYASIADDTYAPYARSNLELTDDLRLLSKGWQNITGITGSANEIVSFRDLIGATTLLIDCEYKNAAGGHYTTTNLVHANGASDLIALRAIDVANFYESCRSITWDSATGTLTLKSLGRNRLLDGTISEDKLFCYPLRIKPIY